MMDLIVLGQVPGTQVQINFYTFVQAVTILFGAVCIMTFIYKRHFTRRNDTTISAL
jgi:hypothetical protein